MRFFLTINWLLAFASFAQTPISEFPTGNYLSTGHIYGTNGGESEYASFAALSSDSLNLSIVRDGEVFAYDLDVTFSENGFFSVEALEDDETHYGWGYCRSVQCHFEFDLGDRDVEETLTFNDDFSILVMGSMTYIDDDGVEQAISWEEHLFRIGDCDDDDGEDDDDDDDTVIHSCNR
jgi:hypothetical protein